MRLSPFLVLLAPLAMLSACGGTADNGAATETRMDDLDSLEGTISDDAINTDQSTEEGPMEAGPGTAAPGTAAPDKGERPKAATEVGGPDVVPITETGDKADIE